MKFGTIDGREDGEYKDGGFEEPFDRIHHSFRTFNHWDSTSPTALHHDRLKLIDCVEHNAY